MLEIHQRNIFGRLFHPTESYHTITDSSCERDHFLCGYESIYFLGILTLKNENATLIYHMYPCFIFAYIDVPVQIGIYQFAYVIQDV